MSRCGPLWLRWDSPESRDGALNPDTQPCALTAAGKGEFSCPAKNLETAGSNFWCLDDQEQQEGIEGGSAGDEQKTERAKVGNKGEGQAGCL